MPGKLVNESDLPSLKKKTSLITCSAGFNSQHVIPGFDLCRKNLPINATASPFSRVFTAPNSGIPWPVAREGDRKQTSGSGARKRRTRRGSKVWIVSNSTALEEVLSFSLSDNASWNALGTAGQNIPFIIVSWRIPGETIVVDYYSMEVAQRKMRGLDKKIRKGRRIHAKMSDRLRRRGFRPSPSSFSTVSP